MERNTRNIGRVRPEVWGWPQLFNFKYVQHIWRVVMVPAACKCAYGSGYVQL
jgi:hypothetical protein